jgi:hypothetical protein
VCPEEIGAAISIHIVQSAQDFFDGNRKVENGPKIGNVIFYSKIIFRCVQKSIKNDNL